MTDEQITRPLGPLSRSLERLGSSRRAHRMVTGSPAAREVARRFVAAEHPEQALRLVADQRDKGLEASLEPLLPTAQDREQATRARRAHLTLVEAIGRAGLGPVSEVSVRLSSLGQALPRDGQHLSTANLAEICAAARNAGSRVTLELEDHGTTDATFASFTTLQQDYPWLGVTVQSQLRRSLADSRWLATLPARVRLCKGGYSEPHSVSLTSREEIDANFAACMAVLMAGKGYPMLATHDPRLVALADEQAASHHRSREDYEFQMYHGVRPWEHRRLVDTGHRVRVHLPVGPDWYSYLVRRVAERPANVMPLLRALVTRR
ncbi:MULTISPECIES: proline dehydrogenase family protein [unclassified Luteococcus]|uniref:proline dehydrogenase family protein n=1 Tax=unclassified Luteococcus TaxID=2639923 RepID=UPI00313A8F4C